VGVVGIVVLVGEAVVVGVTVDVGDGVAGVAVLVGEEVGGTVAVAVGEGGAVVSPSPHAAAINDSARSARTKCRMAPPSRMRRFPTRDLRPDSIAVLSPR
jgi:hypothetical protein